MRFLLLLIAIPFCLQHSAAAAEHDSTCDKPFEAAYRSGGLLKLELRSGDIDIAGVDSESVRVTCETEDKDDARDIEIRFSKGELRVHGGPRDKVRIRVEVPRRSHLHVRCTAGDVDIDRVTGDKDVHLRAGDLTIHVGDPADYAQVDASVTAGDLKATAFGVHKGGLWRSFHQSRKEGSYNLRARLWAGDLKLR
jgi:Putative adhesin